MPAVRDGDNILIIDRKLFHDDNTRFFVGVVEEYDDGVVRLRGFPFHLSPYEVTGIERHGEERVRVLAVSGDVLVYMLPRETELEKMQLQPKNLRRYEHHDSELEGETLPRRDQSCEDHQLSRWST